MFLLFQSKAERKRQTRAVTALEYALIAAAITGVIAVTLFILGITVNQLFDHTWDALRGHSRYARGG